MKTVILAEKPSQALAYAQSFKASKKKEGYFEISDPLFSGETFITFGFGHLVELAEPGYYDERWKNGRSMHFQFSPINLCLTCRKIRKNNLTSSQNF